MELFELVLLFLAAILVSSVVDQMLPRVSLPLIQIAIGAVVALFTGGTGYTIDSELFLVMLIAPLLFDESRNVSKRDVWNNKGAIISLAVGLVLVTVLVVGFVLHWIEPSIPLAAAFALGAALGPTDAVAVGSLSKDIVLTKRQSTLLSGEALINDASGVVSFQFAIAAATTGAFSLLDAGASFVATFFGGIIVGLVLGLVAVVITRLIRNGGYESVTVHVVFELFTPFVVFLLAEAIGVSGILAVVAAGLLTSFMPQPVNPLTTRLSIASSSVWEVLVFVANGVVFVLLGMELPQAIMPGWQDTEMNSAFIIVVSVVVTLVVMLVRFVWVFVMEMFSKADPSTNGKMRGINLAVARDSLVTTLAGPKGAVTMSIMFTVPLTVSSGAEFPYRNTLVCVASFVIVWTLLLANFVTPLVAPKKNEEAEEKRKGAIADILKGVIAEMRERTTPQNAQAMQVVIRAYQTRLSQLGETGITNEKVRELSEGVLDQQRDFVEFSVAAGEISEERAHRCLDQLARVTRLLDRHRTPGQRRRVSNADAIKLTARSAVESIRNKKSDPGTERENLSFMIKLEMRSLSYLNAFKNSEDPETAQAAHVLIAEHKATLSSLKERFAECEQRASEAAKAEGEAAVAGAEAAAGTTSTSPKTASAIQSTQNAARQTLELASDLYAKALRVELDNIQKAREEGTISRATAQELREEVYLLQMGLNENRR